MLGLCTGLLPAAAASVARSAAELFDLSLMILALVIRCAAQLLQRSWSIEDAPRTSTWGYLITSMPAERQQELIDKFHVDQVQCFPPRPCSLWLLIPVRVYLVIAQRTSA
jgi:hypothetical protein